MQLPQNDVRIRRNDQGGWSVMLNGLELADHADTWRVGSSEHPLDLPVLTLTITCDTIDVADDSGGNA